VEVEVDFLDEPTAVVRLALSAQHRDFGIRVPMDGVDRAFAREASVAVHTEAGAAVRVVSAEVIGVPAAIALGRFAASFCVAQAEALPVSAEAVPAELPDQPALVEE
jgi:hypothetical protein